MVQILDGKVVRDQIAEELKGEISRLHSKCKLVIIQVGDLAESNTYIGQKIKFGEKIGAAVDHRKFTEDVTQEKLISDIRNLNSDSSINGIIVQMPIPNHLDKDTIIDTIDPVKDVDGLTSHNIKLLFENRSEGYTPATTKGILTLLDFYKIPVEGQHVVIVGRSTLVGKPTALAFLNRNATVTVCHSKTRNLKQMTRNADILVAAVGSPKLITKDYVSKGQVVVDVGINVIDSIAEFIPNKKEILRSTQDDSSEGLQNDRGSSPQDRTIKSEMEPVARKLIGDVDFEQVSKIVKAISPVPGGCGPMTVASLFQNLLETFKNQQ